MTSSNLHHILIEYNDNEKNVVLLNEPQEASHDQATLDALLPKEPEPAHLGLEFEQQYEQAQKEQQSGDWGAAVETLSVALQPFAEEMPSVWASQLARWRALRQRVQRMQERSSILWQKGQVAYQQLLHERADEDQDGTAITLMLQLEDELLTIADEAQAVGGTLPDELTQRGQQATLLYERAEGARLAFTAASASDGLIILRETIERHGRDSILNALERQLAQRKLSDEKGDTPLAQNEAPKLPDEAPELPHEAPELPHEAPKLPDEKGDTSTAPNIRGVREEIPLLRGNLGVCQDQKGRRETLLQQIIRARTALTVATTLDELDQLLAQLETLPQEVDVQLAPIEERSLYYDLLKEVHQQQQTQRIGATYEAQAKEFMQEQKYILAEEALKQAIAIIREGDKKAILQMHLYDVQHKAKKERQREETLERGQNFLIEGHYLQARQALRRAQNAGAQVKALLDTAWAGMVLESAKKAWQKEQDWEATEEDIAEALELASPHAEGEELVREILRWQKELKREQ